MGINKVQFPKGLSMVKFMDCNGTAEQCHAALVRRAARRVLSVRNAVVRVITPSNG